MTGEFGHITQLREPLQPHSKSIGANGRPHMYFSGEAIAERVHEIGAFIGPAHAFTPWTALSASHDSVTRLLWQQPIDFVELGLWADDWFRAGRPDFAGVPFLSNSDAHSPQTGEDRPRVQPYPASGEVLVRGVLDSIRAGAIEANPSFFPEEGKYQPDRLRPLLYPVYSRTTRQRAWRCPADGGLIKKGVYGRTRELSRGTPGSRPPYFHLVPLGQIIQTVEGVSSQDTIKCPKSTVRSSQEFGNEIDVLIKTPVT